MERPLTRIVEVLCRNSRILKLATDILNALSPSGSFSSTSDSQSKIVRHQQTEELLERWDAVILQLKRTHLHLFLSTGFDGIENDPVLILKPKRHRLLAAVEDEDLADLLHVRDEKADNTDGGTFTTGAWQTRDLNTVKTNEIAGASLASDQITLPAGTYFIRARAPAFIVGSNVIKLRDITGATDLIIGSVARSGGSGDSAPDSVIWGRFTLSVQSDLEIQHRGSYAEYRWSWTCFWCWCCRSIYRS
ncbi:hypothetical protein LCGC14_1912820 [marine sediment metagenome]|uniref:Uncharacterized protein n=1 Tax=marine sediment metagenome TaxID=412755 RepID=A0A0F9I748_9ZZZZ